MSVAGTKGVPRAERERMILDVATDAFGRLGHAGASLAPIATQVGVSKQLVLTYFGSKDGLYAACVERAGANLAERIEPVLATAAPPLEMAQATLAAIFAGLEGRPHDWNVINDRTVPAGGPAHAAASRVRKTITGQASRGVGRLATLDLLDDADDLSALTEIWTSAVTALVNWWLAHPEHDAADMTRRSRRIIAALAGMSA